MASKVPRFARGDSQDDLNAHSLNTLVHVEEFQYIDDAIAREKEIKGWRRSKKDALVEASNPPWADLADSGIAKGPSLRSG